MFENHSTLFESQSNKRFGKISSENVYETSPQKCEIVSTKLSEKLKKLNTKTDNLKFKNGSVITKKYQIEIVFYHKGVCLIM